MASEFPVDDETFREDLENIRRDIQSWKEEGDEDFEVGLEISPEQITYITEGHTGGDEKVIFKIEHIGNYVVPHYYKVGEAAETDDPKFLDIFEDEILDILRDSIEPMNYDPNYLNNNNGNNNINNNGNNNNGNNNNGNNANNNNSNNSNNNSDPTAISHSSNLTNSDPIASNNDPTTVNNAKNNKKTSKRRRRTTRRRKTRRRAKRGGRR
jgi:hypothetical protein